MTGNVTISLIVAAVFVPLSVREGSKLSINCHLSQNDDALTF